MADDVETHDIGVRAIRARYYREAVAWECLIEAFKLKPVEQLTPNLPIALAKLIGQDDIGYYSDEIPRHVRNPAIAKVLTFGADEIAKLLSMLPDSDFERRSLGYSLMPLFGQSAESPHILSAIRDNDAFDPAIRQLAGSFRLVPARLRLVSLLASRHGQMELNNGVCSLGVIWTGDGTFEPARGAWSDDAGGQKLTG